ncbi:MAG: hypothetical protein JO242_25185 [Streptosporangiaceae bacterium]|nr:hypothetical protein [Streptosporangiaceae bacterium]
MPLGGREKAPMNPQFSIVTAKGGHRILMTADGTRVETPPVEHLAFYTGVGLLAAAEIIEWPVALLLMGGHILIGLTNRPALKELGEALDAI